MQKSTGLSAIIKKERENKKMTLKELSKESGVPISTLSKIENGFPNVKKEVIEKIAKGLLISVEKLINQKEPPLRIGVGATLMAAPLIYGIGENKYSKNLVLSYYQDNEDLAEFEFKDPPSENRPNKASKLLTAPTLIKALLDKKYEAVFIPSETYTFHEKEEVMKVASIMNTAKGALLFLACTVTENTDSPSNLDEIAKNFSQGKYSESHFFYLKDTIADKIVRNLFLNKGVKKFSFYERVMEDLSEFTKKLVEEIQNKCLPHNTVFYAGWEPHISILQNKIENYRAKIGEDQKKIHTRVFEISEFMQIDEPFDHISFDCVIRTDNKELLKARDDFKDLFKLIRTSINKLNEIKSYKGIHPSLKKISELLLMEKEEQTHQALHKMNFELQFYPEWVL